MRKLNNFILGKAIQGKDDGQILYNAYNGTPIYTASTNGIDMHEIVEYARKVGNPNLRKLSFQERGRMLRALAMHLLSKKDFFYQISYNTGATKADSWIDIEGGIGNLFANASLRRRLPDTSFCIDGDYHILGKQNSFGAQHILVPKLGVAVHINAFNFPVWGMLEKISVNLLAGMPCIVKPATLTSYLTEVVVDEILKSNILPKGALQLICGSAGNILDVLDAQDVVTFTGSADTGIKLKSNKNLIANAVPFNMEADSLNSMVLGDDVSPNDAEWDIFIKEVRKEMTAKAGQKCTAVRRIFVPENKIEDVWKSLTQSLQQTTIGNPQNEKVRMGSLAGQDQRNEVREKTNELLTENTILYGNLNSAELVDADYNNGAFISPILMLNDAPYTKTKVHDIEAFGPVSTIMPYKELNQAIELSRMGKGSLCCSIVTNNHNIAQDFVINAATHHGRILVLNRACAQENTGHGSPLPLLVHGGPGRAGGGEEMGGLRGIKHYMQRTAVQGSPTLLSKITQVHHQHGEGNRTSIHPFKKYFEELEISDQLITEKRKITKDDIDAFAELSGDKFYAHLTDTDFSDTMFDEQVAHGYFLLSAAAGLFVDSFEKNPVLLNYGIDEFRFTKPMYVGNSFYVRFTCKEKIMQDKKEPTDIDKGIVKWMVELFDDTDELAGLGTILTMVRTKNKT